MLCKYNKLCKRQVFSNSTCLCYYHLLLKHSDNIINIQKTFRGYKTRKKIKNIYIRLPDDIQNMVLFYINLPIYYNNYYKKLNQIIKKKTKDLIYYNYNHIPGNKLNMDYISNCYYYINKYHAVMNINEIKILYVFNDELKLIINDFIYNYFIDIPNINILHNNIFAEIINFENNSFDKLILLYNRINNFNNIYNYYYSILPNNSII